MDEETLEQDLEELDETTPSEDDVHSNEGVGEDTPQTFKIGDKDYTAEQLEEFEKKASGYDALLPEFTRKSQELAGLKKGQEPSKATLFENPDYRPASYNEYYHHIRDEIKRETAEEQRIETEKQAEIKGQVDGFIAEVKKTDKNFDEKDFSDYALRHKFQLNTMDDLRAVHSAYKDLQGLGEKTKEKGNVSKPSNQGGSSPNFSDIRARGGSILDGALEAFNRLKT